MEDALYTHAAVREAAVVGEPDPYRGEPVIAYVSLQAAGQAEPADLITHCRELLASYKCPREVRVLDELPKTVSGKIQRNVLRERGLEAGSESSSAKRRRTARYWRIDRPSTYFGASLADVRRARQTRYSSREASLAG